MSANSRPWRQSLFSLRLRLGIPWGMECAHSSHYRADGMQHETANVVRVLIQLL